MPDHQARLFCNATRPGHARGSDALQHRACADPTRTTSWSIQPSTGEAQRGYRDSDTHPPCPFAGTLSPHVSCTTGDPAATREATRRHATPIPSTLCGGGEKIPLGLPNHQALSCRVNRVLGHAGQGIEFKNARDLDEEPVHQAEVAARDPNDRRDGLVCPGLYGEMDPLGGPLLGQ